MHCNLEGDFLNYFRNCDSTISGAELSNPENQVCQALLKHLQLLQFNAHEVFETLSRSPTQIKGSRTQYLGVAIYISVALFNHDCYPTVSRYVAQNESTHLFFSGN